jgi:hypothetical protein
MDMDMDTKEMTCFKTVKRILDKISPFYCWNMKRDWRQTELYIEHSNMNERIGISA